MTPPPPGPRARPLSAAVRWLQPRSRREGLLVLGIVVITAFFSLRLYQLHPAKGASVVAASSTNKVLRRFFVHEPTLVTEVIINRRPKRPSARSAAGGSAGSDPSRLEHRIHAAIRPLKPKAEAPAEQQAISQDGTTESEPAGGAPAASPAQAPAAGQSQQQAALKPAVDTADLIRASLFKPRQRARPAGATLAPLTAAAGRPRQPEDFDLQTFLLYQPELRYSGITTEELAKRHYLDFGRAEGRLYRRLRVLLRYTACTGLINQHYSHIASIALAAVLGAEVVLPPAVKRDSFAHYFSTIKENNQVAWTPAPLESLLDVERIIDFWRRRGLILHRTPGLLPFPDLTQPEVAYPLYAQPDVNPRYVARIDGVYLQNLDMDDLIEKARVAVVNRAGAILRENPDEDIAYIALDLPCTFFMLRAQSKLRVVSEVAKSLEFAPAIQALANKVVRGITAGGAAEFNAVHLRIEKDAKDWSIIMGGEAVVWHNYVQAMRVAGFSADAMLYGASGLLTYGANEDMAHIVRTLKEFGLCKELLYKELYLSEEELAGLNSEQKALVDFLVLSRGRAFVGFGSSTFSFYLREFRGLNGLARASSVMVDASVIGTDPLFLAAGTVS